MVLTMLKQTTRYYLDEKDYEVANIYADMYCQMILQYVHRRDHAILALKDLSYEFFIIGHYRSATKYYKEIITNYGPRALGEKDYLNYAESCQKLQKYDDALNLYNQLIEYYPYTPEAKVALNHVDEIAELCGNRHMSKVLHLNMSSLEEEKRPRKKIGPLQFSRGASHSSSR